MTLRGVEGSTPLVDNPGTPCTSEDNSPSPTARPRKYKYYNLLSLLSTVLKIGHIVQVHRG